MPKKKMIPRNRSGSVVETSNRPSLLMLAQRDAVQRALTDREKKLVERGQQCNQSQNNVDGSEATQ